MHVGMSIATGPQITAVAKNHPNFGVVDRHLQLVGPIALINLNPVPSIATWDRLFPKSWLKCLSEIGTKFGRYDLLRPREGKVMIQEWEPNTHDQGRKPLES